MLRQFTGCVAVCLASSAWAGEFTLSSGLSFSEYDNPRVLETGMPLSLSYRSGDWSLDASGNWRDQRSAATATSPAIKGYRPLRLAGRTIWVPVTGPRPDGSAARVSGWGDLNLGLSRSFMLGELEEGSSLDLRAVVKLPTGSQAKGFSTGKTDWSLGGSYSRSMGPYSLSWTSGYNWIGKQSGYATRNTWSSDLYLGYGLSDGLDLGLDYAWSQSATPGGEASRTLTLSTGLPLGERGYFTFSYLRGFSDADPQQDFNFSYNYSFR